MFCCFRVTLQVVLRTGDQPRLLAPVNALGATAEPGVPTVSYLNEHQAVPVGQHQVDFTLPTPVIAGNAAQAACFQVTQGAGFGGPAAGGRIRVQR